MAFVKNWTDTGVKKMKLGKPKKVKVKGMKIKKAGLPKSIKLGIGAGI